MRSVHARIDRSAVGGAVRSELGAAQVSVVCEGVMSVLPTPDILTIVGGTDVLFRSGRVDMHPNEVIPEKEALRTAGSRAANL